MTLSLGFIFLAACLARWWIKERGASCLKIGGELSGANCPRGELTGYPCNHRSYKTTQEKYKNYLMSVSELDSSESDGSSSENNDEFELKEVKKK